MAVLFEIYLKSVLVMENGKVGEKVDGVNTLAVNLIYPREGVSAVSSMRSLSLQDGEPLDLENADIRYRFLLKEVIRGNSILEVEVTAMEKVSKIEKLAHDLFSTAVNAAINAVPGVGTIITGAIRNATSSLFSSNTPEDRILVIGSGFMPLTESTPEGDFTVNLAVPETVSIYQREQNDKGDIVERKRTLKAGAINAKVVFELKKFVM